MPNRQDDRLPSWIPVEFETPRTNRRHVAPFSREFSVISNKRRQETSPEYKYVESHLVQLCRSGNWREVVQRCSSNPEEATPRLIEAGAYVSNRYNIHPVKRVVNHEKQFTHDRDTLYHTTALGIACASENIEVTVLNDVVLALVKASPSQVCASQRISGHTPLRDAILSPRCTPQILKVLLDADSKCREGMHTKMKSALHKKRPQWSISRRPSSHRSAARIQSTANEFDKNVFSIHLKTEQFFLRTCVTTHKASYYWYIIRDQATYCRCFTFFLRFHGRSFTNASHH